MRLQVLKHTLQAAAAPADRQAEGGQAPHVVAIKHTDYNKCTTMCCDPVTLPSTRLRK